MIKNWKHNSNGIHTAIGRGFLAGALLLAALPFAGCGSRLPNLNDGQMDQVAEYAANLLIKYDSNNRMRLMSEEEMQKEEEKRAAWDVPYPSAEPTESPEDPKGSENQGSEEKPDVPPVQYGALEDLFELPSGVGIQYTGYFTSERYPDDLTGFDASAGMEILALQFVLQNDTDATQNIDLLNQDITYRITVNGSNTSSQMLTMLDNDLATYQGKIPSGDSLELVLLTEIEEGTEVNSLTMRGKKADGESTILLK